MESLPAQYESLDASLRAQGLCIVPLESTKAMQDAAGNATRKRKEALGDDWFYLSTRAKAAVRWDAMLKAWRP